MVFAKFCHVVERIHSVKSKIDAYIAENGWSIRQLFVALYYRTVSSDFTRKVAETFTTRIVLICIGFLTSVIVARILGPEGRGLYGVAGAIGAIGVQLGNLGLHASNTYYVAKDRKLLPALIGNTIIVSFVLGSMGAGLAWAVFSIWDNLTSLDGLLLILALVWVPIGLAYMLLQNLLIGIQAIRAYNIVELVSQILGLVIIWGLIMFGTVTVESVFSAGLIALTISLIWALWKLRPYVSHFPTPSFALFKDNIHYGLKAYLSALFAFLVLRADILIVNYLLGAEQTGCYSISVSMANMIHLFPVVVGSIFFPKLCAIDDWFDKFRFAKTISIVMCAIMIPGIVVAILSADIAVTFFLGHAYADSATPFKWLMPGILILSIEGIARRLLISDGYRIEVVCAWFITFIVNVCLNFVLIPKMGIKGAALASSISFALLAGMTIVLIQKLVEQARLSSVKNGDKT